MTIGNTGKDNRSVGKPENYCGSYHLKKKKESTLDRKKGKIGVMTILIDVKAEIFFFGKNTHYIDWYFYIKQEKHCVDLL